MAPIIALGFGAFFVVSLAVGLRLMRLWWRTRELPELLIGTGVLGIGPVGFGFSTLGALTISSHPGLGQLLFGLSLFSIALGAFSKYLFNWRVYHPQSRGVGAAVAATGGLLALCFVLQLVGGGLRAPDQLTPAAILRQVLLLGCLLWGSLEALHYWTRMRRRVRLGLADPLTTNRFLMWGLGAGFAGLGSAVAFAAQLATGLPMLEIPGVTLSSSAHGLLAAVAIWLAFLPPRRYRRFLETHASRA